MRRFGVVGLTVLGALAVSASLASTAIGEYKITELPQLGRCVKVTTPKTGEWTGSHCQQHVATTKGEYEFLQGPGPGGKNKFEAHLDALVEGSPVPLRTDNAANKILCTVGLTIPEAGTDEYTGAKSLKEKLVMQGCALASTHQSCTSEFGTPQKETEITLSAEGTLGFTKIGKEPKAGWDLVGIADEIVCGAPGETNPVVKDKLSGSVIAPVTPLALMTLESFLTYRAVAGTGKQIPEKFVGEPQDVLTSTIEPVTIPPTSASVEQTALVGKETFENEEELEVKVLCIDSVTKKPCT